jgi:hypothetical protein
MGLAASAKSDELAVGTRPLVFRVSVYALAFLVTTVLHELAHALVSAAQGGRPVLHHSYVRSEGLQGGPLVATAAAGPLFSLAQGILLLPVVPALARRAAWRLFAFWCCVDGFVNFFGYLVTTPFASNADLGKVAAWLALPPLAIWALFAIGIATNGLIGALTARPMLRFGFDRAELATSAGRARTIVQVGVVPWLLGTLVVVLASLSSPHWLSRVYPVLSGFFLIGAWRRARRISPPEITARQWDPIASWPWLLALAVSLLVYVLVLGPGVRITG